MGVAHGVHPIKALEGILGRVRGDARFAVPAVRSARDEEDKKGEKAQSAEAV